MRMHAAAIPYRMNPSGELQVLLVTSRRRGRWVLPKGRVQRRASPHASAQREAFEEAGVLGEIDRLPAARYHKYKPIDERLVELKVDAYPLRVQTELASWPERTLRRRRWMSVRDAMDAVDDVGLRTAIQSLARMLHP